MISEIQGKWVIRVRVLMQPIEVIAWFTQEGYPNPIRYKLISDDTASVVVIFFHSAQIAVNSGRIRLDFRKTRFVNLLN